MEEHTPNVHAPITAALRIAASATIRETAIAAQTGARELRAALLQLHIGLHAEPDAITTLDTALLVLELRQLVHIAEALGEPLLDRNPTLTVALFPRGSKFDEPTGMFPTKSIAERVGQALFGGEYVTGPWMTDEDRRRTLALVHGRNPDE